MAEKVDPKEKGTFQDRGARRRGNYEYGTTKKRAHMDKAGVVPARGVGVLRGVDG
jgi:hypothetical protein